MESVIGYILLSISISVIYYFHLKKTKEYYYWEGRGVGWKECETKSINRAKKNNYDMEKFLCNIIE